MTPKYRDTGGRPQLRNAILATLWLDSGPLSGPSRQARDGRNGISFDLGLCHGASGSEDLSNADEHEGGAPGGGEGSWKRAIQSEAEQG